MTNDSRSLHSLRSYREAASSLDPRYGSEVAPAGPVQDMMQIDTIAGTVYDRRASPAEFTGGDGEIGLGGTAEPGPDSQFYDRIGF